MEKLTAFEWQVIRDIVVNTPQDKFHSSYSLMSSIVSKVIDAYHAEVKAENWDGMVNEYMPSKKELAQYGLSAR